MIHDLTEVNQWHHIDGTLNPADLASRGIASTDKEMTKLWLQGPTFLRGNEYPKSDASFTNSDDQQKEEEGNVLASSN